MCEVEVEDEEVFVGKSLTATVTWGEKKLGWQNENSEIWRPTLLVTMIARKA